MDKVNDKYGYIYKIINVINGKIYVGKRVGSTLDEKYWGSGTKIKKAIQEFGLNNFNREIIEWCSNSDILRERERYWIAKLDSRNPDIGYNIKRGGEGIGKVVIGTNIKNNKIIGVQVPDFLLEPLQKEADELCISLSAMMRLILAQRYRNCAKLNDVEEN